MSTRSYSQGELPFHGAVAPMPDKYKPPSTCDWGACDEPAMLMRYDRKLGWLVVCVDCAVLPIDKEWTR